MEAKSTDRKTIQLTENRQHLGELTYKSLLSHKAEIKLKNSELITIEPVGLFNSSISITKNGAELAKLTMDWRGQILLTFQDGQEFLFKAAGTFRNKFILETKAGEKLIQFDPKFSWSTFNYSFTISCNKEPQTILLILLGVYAANYFIATTSMS
ncbi:MAG: hypothetical protein EOO39_01285 [Cytophagaceae bacterium]|nr:MAG: hypothetical protein EOO39_01285 [Cytophagaceae bacterium]